jgi:hypothetical protein
MRAPLSLRIVAAQEDAETAAHLERHVGDTVEVEGRWQSAAPAQSGALAVTAIFGAEDARRRD